MSLPCMPGAESYAGNYDLARRLCNRAEKMNKDREASSGWCAEALRHAGELTQAEAMAVKLDRLSPEDTLQQKVYLQLIRSIIERRRGNAVKAADLLAPAMQYEANGRLLFYQRAQAYLAAGLYAKAAADFKSSTSVTGMRIGGKYMLRWRNSVARGPMPCKATAITAARPTVLCRKQCPGRQALSPGGGGESRQRLARPLCLGTSACRRRDTG